MVVIFRPLCEGRVVQLAACPCDAERRLIGALALDCVFESGAEFHMVHQFRHHALLYGCGLLACRHLIIKFVYVIQNLSIQVITSFARQIGAQGQNFLLYPKLALARGNTVYNPRRDLAVGSNPRGGNMSQHVTITAAHWVYLAGVMAVVLTMILRANVVVPSIIATFAVALVWTHSPVSALGSIFNASFVAAKELFNIFLVIALITSLLNALKSLRSDVLMVQPFRTVMTNGHTAFFVLSAVTYVISLFFWPTPAAPLVSAVFVPPAISPGQPPPPGANGDPHHGPGKALSAELGDRAAPWNN